MKTRRFRTASVIILFLLIVFSTTYLSAFAMSTAIDEDQTALSKSDFEVFSQTANTLLTNEIATIDKSYLVSPDSQWIPLKDAKGIEYAYFIPLFDKSQKSIIGYSVVSFAGEPRSLVTASGNFHAVFAEAIYDYSQTAEDILYEFPDLFLCEYDGSYYKICINGELELINDISKYESRTVEFLTTRSANAKAITPLSNDEVYVYGSLNNWQVGSFVPIPEGPGYYYYGGFQSWLEDEGISEFYANRSCGVTAVANMCYHLSKNVTGMSNLFYGAATKVNFSAYQRNVYNYLSPAIWGIPTINVIASRTVEFASSRGVTLTPTFFNGGWSEVNVRDYIVRGLNAECPVLLLTWNSPIPDLTNHWVVITRIYYALGSGTKMVTSNWGSQATYDFVTWVNAGSLNQGVLYFE